MTTMNYYLINLDDNKDRLASAVNQLSHHQIEFKRISAFDGRHLDLSKFEKYDRERSLSYMGRELVGGEIGCYMSHLQCAKAFLNSEDEFCVVLEDDFKIIPLNFNEIIEKTLVWLKSSDHRDWLLINIGNSKLKLSTGIYKSIQSDHMLHKAYYFPMTTTGLIWSRGGAEQFIRNSDSIFAPVDNYFRYWLTRAGGGLCFSPPLLETISAPSSIDSNIRRARQKRVFYYPLIKQRRLWEDKLLAIRSKYLRGN